jgi:hypothetical protein
MFHRRNLNGTLLGWPPVTLLTGLEIEIEDVHSACFLSLTKESIDHVERTFLSP